MSAHTPGPWLHKRDGVVVGGSEIQLPRGKVQQQVAMCCVIDDGERDANARLIAAAPELLAFAQTYLEHYQSEDGMYSAKHYARMAQAAIAAATGGQA